MISMMSSAFMGKSIALILSRLFGAVFGAVATGYVARILGVQHFGTFASALMAVGMLSMIADFGIPQALIVLLKDDLKSDALADAFTFRITTSLVAGLVYLAYVSKLPSASSSEYLLGMTIPIGTLLLAQAHHYAHLNLSSIIVSGLVQSVIYTTCCGAVMYLHATAIWVSVGYLLSVLAQGLVLLSGTRIVFHLKVPRDRLLRLGRSGYPLLISSIMFLLIHRLPLIISPFVISGKDLSILQGSARILDALFLIPGTVVPILLSWFRGSQSGKYTPAQMAGYVVILCGLVQLALSYFAADLLRLLIGYESSDAKHLLLIFVAILIPFSVDCLLGSFAVANEHGHDLVRSGVFAAGFGGITLFPLAHYLGGLGIVTSILIAQFVRLTILCVMYAGRDPLFSLARWTAPLAGFVMSTSASFWVTTSSSLINVLLSIVLLLGTSHTFGLWRYADIKLLVTSKGSS